MFRRVRSTSAAPVALRRVSREGTVGPRDMSATDAVVPTNQIEVDDAPLEPRIQTVVDLLADAIVRRLREGEPEGAER